MRTGDGVDFHPHYSVLYHVSGPRTQLRHMFLSPHAATRTLAGLHGIAMEEAAPNAIDNELRELQFG